MKTSKTVPFPSDFKQKGSTPEKIAQFNLGDMGKMVGGSKSIYRYDNPSNLVVFNANVFTKEHGKIWYGDLDVTKEIQSIKDLAKDLGTSVFVLYESEGRFGAEDSPNLSKAVVEVHKDGRVLLRDSEYTFVADGIPKVKTDEEIIASRPPRQPEILNQEDYEEVSLPDLKSLKVKRGQSPLVAFWDTFIDRIGKDATQELLYNMYLTKSYYEELEGMVTKFCKKKFPGLHPVKVEQSVSMHMFDLGPKSFDDDQQWEKKNTGYVKKSS
jgi:hypothetical protein